VQNPTLTHETMILIIILITVMANIADLLLKVGASRAGDSIASDPLAIFLTPWIWLGAVLGIGAMALWVYILGRHHISLAYPIFVGVGFLNITLASWLFLDEHISTQRLGGIGLILAGIVIVHFQARREALSSEGRAG